MSTTADLDRSVVRVLDPAGRSAGSGFAAGVEGIVVTCAHVVQGAKVGPGEEIDLAWGPTTFRGTVVEEWWSGREVDDIAVLQVAEWPSGLLPLPLSSSSVTGARVETLGFPDASPVGGLRGLGVVAGPVPEPDTGRPVLQIDGAGSVTTGYSGGPIRDLATGHVIAMVHSITPGDRYGRQTDVVLATPAEALRAACPRLRLTDVCPYRSLEVFEEEHARFFFGRSDFVEQMLGRLRQQPRFLAVLGPSGSGKSSVVRAGLLPALAAGRVPGLSDRVRIVIRPTDGLLTDVAAAGVLLVLDQFEEVFLAPPEQLARHARQLCDLLSGTADVSILLVMRDDFYGRLAADVPELIGWVEQGLVNIPATLLPAQLADIVREPARAIGLRFEDGLAEAIVDDAIRAADSGGTAGDGGAATGPAAARNTVLPLLEFALTRLWEQRSDGLLRWQAYLDGGRVAGSLTSRADEAIRSLPPQLLDEARTLLTSLVHLGNPRTGQPDSRRRRTTAELYRSAEQQARLDAVLAVLTAHRLLVTSAERPGGPQVVELIHDVLLREWGRLRQWLADDRQFLSWRQWLEPWVEAWQDDRASTDRLLRGADLATARQYLATRGAEIDPTMREFVDFSAEVWEVEERDRATLRSALDEQQLSRTRARLRDRAAGVARLVQTEPARGLLDAVSLISDTLTALPGDEPLGPVRAALRLAVQRSRELAVADTDAAVRAVAYAPDGLLAAVGCDDGTVRFHEPEEELHGIPVPGHADGVTALAFHPSGETLVSGGEDGAVVVWSRDGQRLETTHARGAVHALAYLDGGDTLVRADETGALSVDGMSLPGSALDPVTAVAGHDRDGWLAVATLAGTLRVHRFRQPDTEPATFAAAHDGFIAALAFQPQGDVLASAGADGVIRLWSCQPDRVEPLGMPWQGHDAAVTALAFGPDGDALLSGSADGSVRQWDVHTRRPAGDPLLGHSEPVTSLAAGPDGTRVISGGADRTVRLWQWRERAYLPEFEPAGEHLFGAGRWDLHGLQDRPAQRRHREHVYRLALSPDARWVATASDDRTVVVSDVDGVTPGRPLIGHQAGVRSVAFSPDGRTLASAGNDRTVRLWDVRGAPLGAPLTFPGPVQAVAFAPVGPLLASGGSDGVVVLTDVRSRRATATLDQGAPVTELVFHPADGRLLSAGEDGLVRVWSAGSGEPAGPPLAAHDGAVRALAVAPGAQLLATGGDDNLVRLWDATGRPVGMPISGHDGGVLDVAFSPDGSMVLSASRDGTVRVWALDGTPLGDPLAGHLPWATSVAVTPDVRYALSAGADGTLRTWPLGGWRDWLGVACHRLHRHPVMSTSPGMAVLEFCAKVIEEGQP